MNKCLRGRELLLDLQRSDFLPPWDEEGVRVVLSEIGESNSMLRTLFETHSVEAMPDSVRVCAAFHRQCSRRNIRYANGYFQHRLSRIRTLRWETGAVLPRRIEQDTLSSREIEYFVQYCSLVGELSDAYQLDLASDLEPPKDLFIEVRVIESCGEIVTENGTVNLQAGSSHFLRRSAVEQQIRLGFLQQVQSSDIL